MNSPLHKTSGGRKSLRALKEFAAILFAMGSVFACFLMVYLFAVGFRVIVRAILVDLRSWSSWDIAASTADTHAATLGAAVLSSSGELIIHVLHGLELLFLAPLPALVFVSLARYFKDFLQLPENPAPFSGETSSSSQLHGIKGLVVGLMTASVATDLLGRAFQGVTITEAVAESLVMLALGMFWFSLERTRHESPPS